MERYDFTFVNNTGEKISFRHQRKNTTGATFALDHGQAKTIKVTIPSQTFEKYLLLDSADKDTTKFVGSDHYRSSQQVTVTKTGDTFEIELVSRNKESAGWVGVWQSLKKMLKLKGKETQVGLPT